MLQAPLISLVVVGAHSQKLNSLLQSCVVVYNVHSTSPKTLRWPDSPYYLCPQTLLTLISCLLFSSKPQFSRFPQDPSSNVVSKLFDLCPAQTCFQINNFLHKMFFSAFLFSFITLFLAQYSSQTFSQSSLPKPLSFSFSLNCSFLQSSL